MTASADTADHVDVLQQHVAGAVHHRGSPEYEALARPWNLAVRNQPVAIVAASSAADVAATVTYAAANGLRVGVQATGHGAVEQPDATIQVDTSGLRELSITATGSARAGAGLRWQEVIDAAAPRGFAPLAGSSPVVGVVGFLTGGGIGPLARTFGVSSDYVTAFEVVTGDGEIRRANAAENPDLFWGLRGGKGALGVVTAVEFDLVELTHFFGGCLYFDGADTASVLHAWQRWTADLPAEATSSVAVLRLPPAPGVPEPLAGKVAVAVRFAWVGDPADGRRVLAPMLAAGTVVLGEVGVMPYPAMGAIHNDPVEPMPVHESSTLLRSLPPEAIDALVALVGAEAECPQVIVELRHLGSAISHERSGPSAVDHRDAAYSLLTIGIAAPPVAGATRAHAAATLGAVDRWSDGSCLPNFQPSSEPAQLVRKYDAGTLRRLAQLSATHDPAGVLAAAGPLRAAAELLT